MLPIHLSTHVSTIDFPFCLHRYLCFICVPTNHLFFYMGHVVLTYPSSTISVIYLFIVYVAYHICTCVYLSSVHPPFSPYLPPCHPPVTCFIHHLYVCVRVICLSLSAYLRDLSTYYDFLCTVYLSIFLSVCLSISLSFCHLSGHRNTLVSALEFELLESKLQAFLAFSPHQ